MLRTSKAEQEVIQAEKPFPPPPSSNVRRRRSEVTRVTSLLPKTLLENDRYDTGSAVLLVLVDLIMFTEFIISRSHLASRNPMSTAVQPVPVGDYRCMT